MLIPGAIKTKKSQCAESQRNKNVLSSRLNSVRQISCCCSYDRGLWSLLHDQYSLHWLDVPERVEYKLAVMVRRCLENKAPKYLHCGYRRQQPTSTISQPASADCTALSEDYIWPSGFLCCRPDGLELTTDRVS